MERVALKSDSRLRRSGRCGRKLAGFNPGQGRNSPVRAQAARAESERRRTEG